MSKRFFAIIAAVMCLMSCMCMTAFADDYGIYKSSYVIAGYGSGVGSMAGTGETYGFYGGLIPGSGDIIGCSVRGQYRKSSGQYTIVYQVELSSPVSAYSEPFCFIPITYDMQVSVSYSVVASDKGPLGPIRVRSENLAKYDGSVTVCGLNYIVSESDIIPGSTSYVATASDCLALPVVATSSTCTRYSIVVTIKNPDAVIEYPYTPDAGEAMIYPFTFIMKDVPLMITYMSYIVSSPIVAQLIYIAAASLLLSIIVGFMR